MKVAPELTRAELIEQMTAFVAGMSGRTGLTMHESWAVALCKQSIRALKDTEQPQKKGK